jgi:uncharacterized protein YegP (UPF0339 family)
MAATLKIVEVYINKAGYFGIRRVARNGRVVGAGEPNGYKTSNGVFSGIDANNWIDAPVRVILQKRNESPEDQRAVRMLSNFQRALIRRDVKFTRKRG